MEPPAPVTITDFNLNYGFGHQDILDLSKWRTQFDSFQDYYSGIRDFETNIFFLNNTTQNKDNIHNHPSPFLANYFC